MSTAGKTDSRNTPTAAALKQWHRAGKRRERRRGVWQPRFWEHTFEDEDDFQRHFDDVHDNPKKHGLVDRVADWPWSSFHRWVRAGVYAPEWGGQTIAAMSAAMEQSTGEP